jgi:hypothetical protein
LEASESPAVDTDADSTRVCADAGAVPFTVTVADEPGVSGPSSQVNDGPDEHAPADAAADAASTAAGTDAENVTASAVRSPTLCTVAVHDSGPPV